MEQSIDLRDNNPKRVSAYCCQFWNCETSVEIYIDDGPDKLDIQMDAGFAMRLADAITAAMKGED